MSSKTAYRQHGIFLEIPENWDVEEQGNEDGDVTITLSDGAAFWALTLMWDRPEMDRVLSEAKEAFESEYEDLDLEEVKSKISRRDAEGFDINFVCLELINHVQLRCFRTGRFTAFLMAQLTDHEKKYYRPLFDEITQSLDVDADGEILIG